MLSGGWNRERGAVAREKMVLLVDLGGRIMMSEEEESVCQREMLTVLLGLILSFARAMKRSKIDLIDGLINKSFKSCTIYAIPTDIIQSRMDVRRP